MSKRTKYRAESRQGWRGKSYRKGGKRVRTLRENLSDRKGSAHISVGDIVRLLRDISRIADVDGNREWVLYGQEGETGEVVEIFRPPSSSANQTGPWTAKVRVGDQIKTYRLTSLERQGEAT